MSSPLPPLTILLPPVALISSSPSFALTVKPVPLTEIWSAFLLPVIVLPVTLASKANVQSSPSTVTFDALMSSLPKVTVLLLTLAFKSRPDVTPATLASVDFALPALL